MDSGYVYGLIDPRDLRIRYVGKTVQKVPVRVGQHLVSMYRDDSAKAEWLRELADENLIPTYVILAEVVAQELDENEKLFIDNLPDLLNEGYGHGGLKNAGSTEQRDRIWEYIEQADRSGHMPGPSEVAQKVGTAKSYAHQIIGEYKNANGRG